MSLTTKDIEQIRLAVCEEATSIVRTELKPIRDDINEIKGELEALRNDIKDIYGMLADLDRRVGQKSILDPAFAKLPDEEQLLRLNDVLLATAKRMGVKLPR